MSLTLTYSRDAAPCPTFGGRTDEAFRSIADDACGGTALNASKLYVTAGGTTYTVNPSSAASELYVAIPDITSQQVTLSA